MPKTVSARLFEAYMTSGKKGGTELGLSYCKRIMKEFGGDITCQSILGEFTEFTMTFPTICSMDSRITSQ